MRNLVGPLLFTLLLCEVATAQQVVVTSARHTAVRTGPSSEHDRITVLPPDIRLRVVKTDGKWHQVRLSVLQDGWIAASDVKPAASQTTPPRASVTNIATFPGPRAVALKIWVSAPVAFRVSQSVAPASLTVSLFGASLSFYGVMQPPTDNLCTAITPRQVASDQADVNVLLAIGQQTGYTASYTPDGALTLAIRRPYATAGLAGKLIALDPGHGGDEKGAVGPTGLLEKDCNLDIALRLAKLLAAAGATAVLTRDADKKLSLEDRVQMSKAAEPDLFLSIHNNSIEEGDVQKVMGTEVYWWTPMSIAPARCLLPAVVAQTGTVPRFTCWRPFYVLRETDTPRILVEIAYTSNKSEEALLKTEAFRQKAAQGLLDGLHAFFDQTSVGH